MEKNIKVLMIDSLVGNDYSYFLSDSLNKVGINVQMVIPEDRIVPSNFNLAIINIMPPKNKPGRKIVKSIKYILYLIQLLYIIKKERIKISHFQFFRRSRLESLFLFLIKSLKCKIVHTVHDISPLDERKIDLFFKLIIYKTADLLLVHSKTNKVTLEKLGVRAKKIRVVPHGNFDNLIPTNTYTVKEARKKIDLMLNDKVLLFFGFVKDYKGLDILLRALKEASFKVNNLTLLVAGAIEDKNLEEKYLKEINLLSSKVKVITHFKFIPREDMPFYFVASDVVVLPYKRISHSGVLHLAYSFGKPVIASRVGDFEEMVEEYKTGLLANVDDAKDLSNKIIEIFASENSRIEMGSYAKKINSEKYSWDNISLILKNIYYDLLTNEKC